MIQNREEFMLTAAIMYYEENLTQSVIAKKMKLSRPTVASLLNEARETGIVNIRIQHQKADLFKKQTIISEYYGLDNVLISESYDNPAQTKDSVGDLAAKLVTSEIKHIKTLGISWGTTVHAFVKAVPFNDHPHLTVVPLIGGVAVSEVEYHSNHLAAILAERFKCETKFLYAPALAESLHLKKLFEQSEIIQPILEDGKKVDLAVVGIGNPIQSETYRKLGFFTDEDIKELENSKAVGDILASFFDDKGQAVNTSVSERIIGLNLTDLDEIKNTMVIGSGREKFAAVKTVLEFHYINHLVIDLDIADLLINHIQKEMENPSE